MCLRTPSSETTELGSDLGPSWAGKAVVCGKASVCGCCCLLKTHISNSGPRLGLVIPPCGGSLATATIQVQALIIALPLCPSSPLLQGPKNTPPHTKNHSYDYRTSSAAKCCGRLCGRYREGQDLPPRDFLSSWKDKKCLLWRWNKVLTLSFPSNEFMVPT